ncbi:hypothetical protein MKW98_012132, partial [Papaver atlanticum]
HKFHQETMLRLCVASNTRSRSASIRESRVSSSDGDHSPSHGNGNHDGGDGLHEAFHQANNEADNTEESGINEEGSKKYATRVGAIARSIVPLCIEDWRSVNWVLKEEIWRAIKNEYRVPKVIKSKALRMANKSWNNMKTILRKWCDQFNTVAERLNNRPQGVKREDCEKFVKLHNSKADQKLREIGKESRKLLKALHTTGRDDIARRQHVMEQQSPTGSVTRTVVYLVTHVYQDIPEEQLELMDPYFYEINCREYVAKVRELNEMEQYREETHLDIDAVSTVFGVDDRGCVRGMEVGISKTELLASVVPREQLRKQVLKTRAVEDRVRSLEVTVETLMDGLSCNPNTSNVNAQDYDLHGMNGGGCQPRTQRVIVRNMRKNCVALRCIDMSRPPPTDE